MRSGEVEGNAGGSLELRVVVELGAVVRRDGFESLRMPAHEAHRTAIRMLLGTSSELADHEVTGFAVDDGDEAVLITLADDGVDLPVTDLRAQFGGGRSLADVTFAGETTTAVVGAVAFAPSACERRAGRCTASRRGCDHARRGGRSSRG